MLTVTGLMQGKCTWCLEATEVVTAKFQDGLAGSFCKKHLWQALKVRSETGAATTMPKPNTNYDEKISAKT